LLTTISLLRLGGAPGALLAQAPVRRRRAMLTYAELGDALTEALFRGPRRVNHG